MATILFSRNARNYTDVSFSTEMIQVSRFTNIFLVGDFRIRLEIVSLTAGASVIISYTIGHGENTDGACMVVYDTPGKYTLGFSRGDLDDTTMISASIQVIGTARIGIEVWSVDVGEDYPEWI